MHSHIISRQNDGECYTMKKTAISFEDQMNEHAFINEPFTLSPESNQASSSIRSHFFYQLLGIKTLLVFIFIAFLIVRRRFISAAIASCFRSIKFISITWKWRAVIISIVIMNCNNKNELELRSWIKKRYWQKKEIWLGKQKILKHYLFSNDWKFWRI